MGVKGLQTFLESKPTIFRLVDIAQMAADYWESHPNAASGPVIVVDGNNCLHQGLGQNFCENQRDWICGGQWDEYMKALKTFMDAFEKIGVKLVFFFDGLVEMSYLEKWLKRRHEYVAAIKDIFEKLEESQPISPNIYTVPPILSYALRAALKYVFKATVYCTVDGECDHALAAFAAKHECMAILAQDTDYIIYPTAPYISMLHLDIHTMHTKIYCRAALCRELGIKEWTLPLFACMLGTDLVTRDSLAEFHKRICARKYIKGLSRIHTVVKCVAEFINREAGSNQAALVQRLPQIYNRMGLGPRNATSLMIFKKSMDFYALDTTDINGFIYPESNQKDDGSDDGIYAVLARKVKNGELLPTILNVICSGRDMFSPSLEDPGADKKTAPCVVVYRPLRQRIYSLMFELKENYFEKGMLVPHTGALLPTQNTVDEWWINPLAITSDDNSNCIKPVSVELPDGISNANVLHDIIMENDEDLLEKKWAVFRACIGLTTSDALFQSLPHQHKSLCAILNYLIQNQNFSIKLWEVEAFLIQAIHNKFGDSDSHMQLQLKPYYPRAVHLATTFLRGVDIVFDLLWFCGNPIEMEYFMPWKFFNGKFFHHIYKDMKMSGGDRVALTAEEVEKFEQLRDVTLDGIDVEACFR